MERGNTMEKNKKPETEAVNGYHLIGAIALGVAIVCLFTGSFLWALVLGFIGYTGLKMGHERFEEAFEQEYRKLLAEEDRKPDPDEEGTSVPAEAPNEESPVQGSEPVRVEVPAPDEQKKKKPFYKRWWFWAIALILLLGSCGQSAEEAEPATEPTTDILATLDAAEVLENASVETAAELIRTIIEETDGANGCDGYEVTCTDDMIYVDFWGTTFLKAIDEAAKGNETVIAVWDELVDAHKDMCKSYMNTLEAMGLADVSVAINISNAVNRENTLLSTVNGITMYNYMDMVLQAEPSESMAEITESTLSPEDQLDEILATYRPEDFEQEQTYILNTSTMKFHYKWCSSVDEISPSNKMEVKTIRSTVVSQGYTACKRCNP